MALNNTVLTKQKSTLVINGATDTVRFTINSIAKYYINPIIRHISSNINNAVSIKAGETKTLIFTADNGYKLPDNVIVTGANSTWNSETGTLILSNPTKEVNFSIIGIATNFVITRDDEYVIEASDMKIECGTED